ncbi:MAG: hypothetical protein JSV88_31005, partial [Candidatus Aminicenantes bacterium]
KAGTGKNLLFLSTSTLIFFTICGMLYFQSVKAAAVKVVFSEVTFEDTLDDLERKYYEKKR